MSTKVRKAGASSGPFAMFALGLAGFMGVGLILAGCTDTSTNPGEDEALWDLAQCDYDLSFLADGGIGLDGIAVISDPFLVDTDSPNEIAYVAGNQRVIGFVVGGQPVAIPLGALWYHEIVNLAQGGVKLVVTHGSLTGSSRVFVRSTNGGSDFGVSGLLYKNNLLMYDRFDPPSLWTQISGEAGCGPRIGNSLAPYPFIEGSWAGWRALHPNTLVLSNLSGNSTAWGQYPYGGYESTPAFLFSEAMPTLDPRRPSKERVLGVPEGTEGGIAFPFGVFEAAGALAVAQGEVTGRGMVVFWQAELKGAAAFWADPAGEALTFTVQDGHFVDQETGTTWSLLGVGSGGGLDGRQLEAIPEATVAYWGAWAAFYPNTDVWEGNQGSGASGQG